MKNIQGKIKEVESKIQNLKSERKYFTFRFKDCKNHECKTIDMMLRAIRRSLFKAEAELRKLKLKNKIMKNKISKNASIPCTARGAAIFWR